VSVNGGLFESRILHVESRSRRVFTTSVALGPLEPLPLASASLEVWCDGSNVLAACDHGTAHLVAVGVNYKFVSTLFCMLTDEFETYETVAGTASVH
jgi:hypothetical protein